MPALLIDGKAIADAIQAEVAEQVAGLGRKPTLAAVLVGEDPASKVYIRNKRRACKRAGIGSRIIRLAAETSQAELLALVDELNDDPEVDGILVQSPLPSHMDEDEVVLRINPRKDVDCFHPENVGLVVTRQPRFLPCTPAGVVELLDRSGVDLTGLNAVVLGRSLIVGRPLSIMLSDRHCTVTVCHTRTKNLPEVCRRADLLIAAAGRPRLVPADWMKPGAIVIDVGIHQAPEGGLCGDVDFEAATQVAALITPVPGGVGPMTIAMLLKNVLKAASL